MAYRTIDETFWSDPKIKKHLSVEEKLLFLYLITNPHSHYSGIYYLPIATITDETSIPEKKLHPCLTHLARVGLGWYDYENDIVWVVNMAEYQMKGQNKGNLIR
ncbi:MAG: hypothetical protein QMD05_10030, partial [Candidatus Brocadiaceae bacterium]|nr:hypothetical protein [Candidatus Brocadiaceae bacterium]